MNREYELLWEALRSQKRILTALEQEARDERNAQHIRNNIDARLSGCRIPLLSPEDLE
jgi:hypothetical protein